MDSRSIKPFSEIPYPWTIGREGYESGADKFYGLNVATSEETPRFATYGEALKEVEKRERK